VVDGAERRIGGVCARAGERETSNAIYVPIK
jgi:hypothetical protein